MSTSNVQHHPDGRPSSINRNSIVIRRTDPNAMSRGNTRVSSSMSSSGGMMAPGTFQALSNTGVTDLKGNRQKEKKDLQDLNERFAGYIEKVHFLEANCKRLEAENEALRNQKQADFEPIRKAYENELDEARKVITDLESTRGDAEAKLAGLRDECDNLRSIVSTLETQAKDYKKKIDTKSSQIGELEGELKGCRLRIENLEDENAKQREMIKKLQDQNRALRADLDAETAAHIESDALCQTKTEEANFYKDLLSEYENMKTEPVQIKGQDFGDFWKNEMQKALRDINLAYDDKLETMQIEMNNKYASQINALKNGNVKDGMSMQRTKDEISRLKGQLSDKTSMNAELSTKLARMTSERDDLARRLSEMERELDSAKIRYDQDMSAMQDELSAVLEQLKTLMDHKMSLELEIACYKKLLEGEETRVGLGKLVEDSLNATEKGDVQNALEAALRDQSSLKESTGSLTVQRSSKGAIAFKSMDHSGGNIIIENTSSGARAKNQNLKGWKMIKTAGGRNTVEVLLKDFELDSGKTFTIWARGAKEKTTETNEQVADNFSFGVGSCVWKLVDESGAEKANLNARFTG